MKSVDADIDRLEVAFDDDALVADAGLLLPATFCRKLGLKTLIDESVRPKGRAGRPNPGLKFLTLVMAMCAGATHIDHVNMLRAGSTGRVLGFAPAAASTVGIFLRSFTWGNVRQLERLLREATRRVWAGTDLGPDAEGPVVIDVDSTIVEVHGYNKQGAAYGYTKQLGLHPLLATVAATGEIVAARLRGGNAGSGRGAKSFFAEIVAHLGRCGIERERVVIRADSAFWKWENLDRLDAVSVGYTVTVSINKKIRQAIAQIPDTAWTPIDYTRGGYAEVAETVYKGRRLVVRRTRLADEAQQALFADWRHHAFTSNLDDAVTTEEIDRFHRNHARVELAVREIKDGGLEHLPSGRFGANGAWLAAAALAHNLTIWTERIGRDRPAADADARTLPPNGTLVSTRTVARRRFKIPGRVVNHGGRPKLRLPTGWPWADRFHRGLDNIRALPALA